MINVSVVGASGYTGAELVSMLTRHPLADLKSIFVSSGSQDAGKTIDSIHGFLDRRCCLKLQPLEDPVQATEEVDAVFLATDHKVSHDIAEKLILHGCTVFDLSGAFRVKSPQFYEQNYGFKHEFPDLLDSSVYALCEYVSVDMLKNSRLISLPGCYPTASQLALRPLVDAGLLDPCMAPVINAVSGVSGAGRKASLTNSFCEVSLNAYGVFKHRHRPEIEAHLGTKVVFTPHLGNFKRGILATVTAKLVEGTSEDTVRTTFLRAYKDSRLVRIKDTWPRVDDVADTPFCDIFFACEGEYIVICSAIDNLLKGASAQAVQAFNLYYDFDETLSLI